MNMRSKRTRIGMLTPSSNTILEPYTCAMLHQLFPDVTAHFQRFTVTEISLEANATAQFNNERLIHAAKLLTDARMDVVAWAGTAASWRGFDADKFLCQQITEATGTPATTSVLALNEILGRSCVRRLGLVTPYLNEVQKHIMENYATAGHPVTSECHLGRRENFAFSEFDELAIAAMIREVATAKPDAIIVLCTNFRGATVVEQMEREVGIPIYDSVSATVWKALSMTGHDPARIAGWGRLFRELR